MAQSSADNESGFDKLEQGVTHQLVSLEEAMPGLLHAVFDVQNFYFTDRIDRYLVLEPGAQGLFIDLGHPVFTGSEHLDEMLQRANVSWEHADVAATHFHADHTGNLSYFLEQGGRTLYHGPIRPLSDEDCRDFAIAAGWPEAIAEHWNELCASVRHTCGAVLPEGVHAVELHTGDAIEVGDWHLQAIETPGHALEHICLGDATRKVLFSGDHIIDAAPSIMQVGREDHVVKRFMDTFPTLKKMRFETVYMSHHEPLHGADAICCFYDAMVEKFRKPLAKRLKLVQELGSATVAEVTRAAQAGHKPLEEMEFGMAMRRFAITFGFLEYLADEGHLNRTADAAGTLHYSL